METQNYTPEQIRLFAESSAEYVWAGATLQDVLDDIGATAKDIYDGLGKRIEDLHAISEDYDQKTLDEAESIMVDYCFDFIN